MIGNISFGISFENGKSRVPIPPAVIKAVYPSMPFDDPVSSIDSMVRPLTRAVPNRWRGTRPTSTSCFQLGYNNGYVRCFEHMRIHGGYVPNVLPSRERTIWEEPVPSVQDLPEFRSSNVIRSENDFFFLPDVQQVLRTRPGSGGPLAIAK